MLLMQPGYLDWSNLRLYHVWFGIYKFLSLNHFFFFPIIQAAIEEGVVVGGGCSLLRLSKKIDAIKESSLDNIEQKVLHNLYLSKRVIYLMKYLVIWGISTLTLRAFAIVIVKFYCYIACSNAMILSWILILYIDV